MLHLRRRSAPPADEVIEAPTAVLLSHFHHDHLDLPSLRRLGRGTRVLVPRGAGAFMRRHGFTAVAELGVGETETVGGVEVTAVEAEHSGSRGPLGPTAEAIGFVVRGSSSVYFAGDTDAFPAMSALAGTLDVALLPVWGWGPTLGPGHLDPEGAARVAAVLKPRIAIPIHWGTFFPIGRRPADLLTRPPRDFAARVASLAPGVEVQVLDPGESLEIGAPLPEAI